MAKIGSPTKRPTSKGGFCGDQEAAPQLVTNRERRNKSGLLAASVRVKFMELRPSMCRWPIGDPKHTETFRFCGSACSSGAIYCKAHTAKAHAPNRPRTPRTTNFRLQHPVRVA
jgi:GcrA cell cycle regulator